MRAVATVEPRCGEFETQGVAGERQGRCGHVAAAAEHGHIAIADGDLAHQGREPRGARDRGAPIPSEQAIGTAEPDDAIVVGEVYGRYYMKQSGKDIYRVLEDNFGEDEMAVAFKKDNKELQERVDAALAEMKEDGTFDEIYDKWFYSE